MQLGYLHGPLESNCGTLGQHLGPPSGRQLERRSSREEKRYPKQMYFICSHRLGEGQQHSFSGIPEVAQNSKIPPELHEHLVIADRGAAISDLIRAIQREL